MHTWTEVDRNETHVKYRIRHLRETHWIFNAVTITSSPPTHAPENPPNELELGQRGYRCRHAGGGAWLLSNDIGPEREPFVPRSSSVGSSVPNTQAAFQPGDEFVSPTEDRYATARKKLAMRIDSENPELDVGYETSRLPGQKDARDRNVAALRADLDSSTSARRRALQKRFGARPGIDDVGGGSGPGWED